MRYSKNQEPLIVYLRTIAKSLYSILKFLCHILAFSICSYYFGFRNHPKNPNVMNPRLFKIANFFAFNLLFFALYLNFIHKDKNVQQAISTSIHTPVATRGLSAPSAEQYVQKEPVTKTVTSEKTSTKALKLSFN